MSNQAARRKRLQGYITVLELIKNAEPENCKQILQELREPRRLGDAVKAVQKRWVSEPKVVAADMFSKGL